MDHMHYENGDAVATTPHTGATYLRTAFLPLDELTPFPGNAKRGDIAAIRASLRRNGQYRSLVVREIEHGPLVVLAGNHTLQALTAEGHQHARCEIITCADDTARRINLADNRTADLGQYDNDALAELLSYLDGDYVGTGYTEEDVEALIAPPDITELEPETEDDDTPDPPAAPISKPGDIWTLGPHRLLCGDCRHHDTVERLLDGQRINLAFTSPPYASQRTYDETSGFTPIPPDEYVDWFEDVQANIRAHLADDGSWFINIKEHVEYGQRHLYVKDLTIAHVRRWGWRFIDELVWHKPDPFPGVFDGRFKNGWEPVFHFSPNKPKHRPDHVRVESGTAILVTHSRSSPAMGRNERFDAATGPGVVLPSNLISLASKTDAKHEAAFPIGLPEWFAKAYTDEGDTIFDPFMGSGSTLLAADRTGRVAYGTEISPGYCDVICRRYQQATGTRPVLASTGEAHDFTAEPANP